MFTISVNPPKPRVEAYAMSGPLRVAVPRAPLRPSPSPPPHSPSSSPATSHPPTRAHPTGVLESVVRMRATWCAVVARSLIPTGQCTAQSSPPGSVALQLIHRMRHQSLPDHHAADIPDTLAPPTPLARPRPSLGARHTPHVLLQARDFAPARLRTTPAAAHALKAIGGGTRHASM